MNYAKTWLTGAFPEVWLYALGALFVLVTLFLPRGIIGLGEGAGEGEGDGTAKEDEHLEMQEDHCSAFEKMSVRNKRLYLEDLTVSFDGFKALNKLSLYVDPGEMLCIIGPNGAGKTTMMDVVTGKTSRIQEQRGLAGASICLKCPRRKSWKQASGRKFQKPTVFEQLTVFENTGTGAWPGPGHS